MSKIDVAQQGALVIHWERYEEVNSLIRDAGFPIVPWADSSNSYAVRYRKSPCNHHLILPFFDNYKKPKHFIIGSRGMDDPGSEVGVAYRQMISLLDAGYMVDIVKDDAEWQTHTSKPYLWRAPSLRDGIWYNDCICYDVNKAYFSVLMMPMPDLHKMWCNSIVREGQIGFVHTGETTVHTYDDGRPPQTRYIITAVGEGEYAEYIFNLTKSPFEKYVNTMLKSITDAKIAKDTKMERIYKLRINAAIGNLQNHNPFLRATIMGYMEKRMTALRDKDTIYSNTDSLVSRVPREDITISDKIGDFKIEAEGNVMFSGYDYDWSTGKSAHRGVVSADEVLFFDNNNLFYMMG